MKIDKYTVTFESDEEVGTILGVLETYLSNVKETEWDEYDDIVKSLVDKLEKATK